MKVDFVIVLAWILALAPFMVDMMLRLIIINLIEMLTCNFTCCAQNWLEDTITPCREERFDYLDPYCDRLISYDFEHYMCISNEIESCGNERYKDYYE